MLLCIVMSTITPTNFVPRLKYMPTCWLIMLNFGHHHQIVVRSLKDEKFLLEFSFFEKCFQIEINNVTVINRRRREL